MDAAANNAGGVGPGAYVITVVKLLEEYPQLSGYLVEASNGYLLAGGALQDYISTQRAEYALALNEAQSAADAIVTAEADKINAINATTLATKDQLTALAELYQSMGANADNLAEGVSYRGSLSGCVRQIQRLL